MTEKTTGTDNNAMTLEEEFLQVSRSSTRRTPIGAFASCVLIVAVGWDTAPEAWLLAWLALQAFALFGRAFYINRQHGNANKSVAQKVSTIYLLNALNGVTLSLSLCFFPAMSVTSRAIQTLLIAGMAAGTASTTGGDAKAYLPYVTITCIPLALMWVLFPADQELWKSAAQCAIILFFGYSVTHIGRDIHTLLKISVDMRGRHLELNKQLQRALAESEQSSAAKTRFLATASHDLRQPVHTLSLLTAALKTRKLDERTQEISQSMDQSLQILSEQLNALLDISKLDAGIIVPRKETIDLSLLLRRVGENNRSTAAQKGLQLELILADNIHVLTDGNLLGSIVQNLISNAIKYTREGSITLSLSADKGTAEIAVIDTGIGIAEEKKELVFEEFYQLDNPHRDKTKGLGLGLSIVRRLVKLLDIEMDMQSTEHQGTQFRLSLPESQEQYHSPKASPEEQFNFSKLRVLVVDDEEQVRIATRLYLQELGCSVLLAESSEQATSIAELNEPDLLLTDFRLKDHDSGLKVIQQIRKTYPQLPAIIMTGDTAPDRLIEANRVDARLLHKPIDISVLKTTMRECFQQ